LAPSLTHGMLGIAVRMPVCVHGNSRQRGWRAAKGRVVGEQGVASTQSGGEPTAHMSGGARGPFRSRAFSLLFIGQFISLLGDQAYAIALPWTVLAVTGDPRQMGIVLAAEAAPRVAFLLLGGALADRFSPRAIMLIADIGRAGVVIALGVTLFNGLPALPIVAALAALQGAGSGLFLPGSQAIVPWTVSEADTPAANGLLQLSLWFSMVVGPILGGAGAGQAAIAFLADGASFVASAVSLAAMRLTRPAAKLAGDRKPDAQEAIVAATGASRVEEADLPAPEATAETMPPTTAETATSVTTTRTVAVIVELTVEEVDAPRQDSPSQDVPAQTMSRNRSSQDAAPPSALTTAPREEVVSHGANASPDTAPARREGLWRAIGVGVAYAFGQPLMRTTMIVATLGNLGFFAAFSVALIVLSRELDPSAVTLGVLLGAAGIGGGFGGLLAGPVGRHRRRGVIVLTLWLVMAALNALIPIVAGSAARLPFPIDLDLANFGVVSVGDVSVGPVNLGAWVAAMGTMDRLVATALLLGLISLIIALGDTALITVLQQRAAPELVGRVFSVQYFVSGVTQPLALALAGVIIPFFGSGVVFFGAAALFACASLIGLSSRSLRRA